MYKDSAVHYAMPSLLTPNLVVGEKNTLEFSFFLLRQQRTKCKTQVLKVKCPSELKALQRTLFPMW